MTDRAVPPAGSRPRFPARYQTVERARATFGHRVDRLGEALWRGDPLADAVVDHFRDAPAGEGWRAVRAALDGGPEALTDAPPALAALLGSVAELPFFLDPDDLARGGEVLFRSGHVGALILALGSLVHGYAAPAGNKPLVFAGGLVERAPRRLNETARFLHVVSIPQMVRPWADGWKTALKVRLMHAHVRHMILRSQRWDIERWGVPINQHDMMSTSILFSTALLEGMRRLGFDLGREECDRYMTLWRWIGELSGVEPMLLPPTYEQGLRTSAIVLATQGAPDDDSRALVSALLDTVPGGANRRAIVAGLCRGLIGDELADGLGLPADRWRWAVPAMRAVIGRAEQVRRLLPGGTALAIRAGRRQWDQRVAEGLQGVEATFEPPGRLSRARH